MPRRRDVPKRRILPDPKFKDVAVSKFVNVLMSEGKKSTAEGIFYDAMELVEQRTKNDPLEIFKESLRNVEPMVGLILSGDGIGGSDE